MTTKVGKILPVAVAVLGLTAVVAVPTFAATTETSDTTVTVTVDKTIAISSNSALSTIAAGAGGAEATQSHAVTIATNSDTGYKLELGMKSDVGDKSNYLVHESYTSGAPAAADRFDPTAGNQASLANGTWGYKLAAGNYNPVPLSNAKTTLRTTAAPTAGDATTVTYGAKAANSQKSGSYSNTVTYTATVNN